MIDRAILMLTNAPMGLEGRQKGKNDEVSGPDIGLFHASER